MALSDMTVSLLMTSPVVCVTPATTLDKAYQLMAVRRIASVPVVDDDGKPVGVLSDTDLLRIGRLQPASLAGVQVLDLPVEPVSQHMHAGVITVSPGTPAAAAAQKLTDNHVHRVFVEDAGRLIGVFSIEEVLLAVRERRIGTAIGEVMTTPVETIAMHTRVADATARLDRAHRSGLAVVDEHDHPIGMFTKTEALKAQHEPADTPVENVMSYSMLLQNWRTPLYRAAAHAYETRTRRVLVMQDRKLVGVLAGLDFAALLAQSG
jgi:CBS domain-containing protein